VCLLLASCPHPAFIAVAGKVDDDVRNGASECEVRLYPEYTGPGIPARVGARGKFVLYGRVAHEAGENCRLAITCDGIVRLNIGVRLWYEKEGWFDIGTIGLTTGPTVTAEVKRGNWITERPKVE
jgi:hypothetical protein